MSSRCLLPVIDFERNSPWRRLSPKRFLQLCLNYYAPSYSSYVRFFLSATPFCCGVYAAVLWYCMPFFQIIDELFSHVLTISIRANNLRFFVKHRLAQLDIFPEFTERLWFLLDNINHCVPGTIVNKGECISFTRRCYYLKWSANIRVHQIHHCFSTIRWLLRKFHSANFSFNAHITVQTVVTLFTAPFELNSIDQFTLYQWFHYFNVSVPEYAVSFMNACATKLWIEIFICTNHIRCSQFVQISADVTNRNLIGSFVNFTPPVAKVYHVALFCQPLYGDKISFDSLNVQNIINFDRFVPVFINKMNINRSFSFCRYFFTCSPCTPSRDDALTNWCLCHVAPKSTIRYKEIFCLWRIDS